jgi:hypothetical protein
MHIYMPTEQFKEVYIHYNIVLVEHHYFRFFALSTFARFGADDWTSEVLSAPRSLFPVAVVLETETEAEVSLMSEPVPLVIDSVIADGCWIDG